MFLKFFRKAHKKNVNGVEGHQHFGIDPAMFYCPSCNAEFRLDVGVCPSCRVSLLSGKQKLAEETERSKRLAERKVALKPDEELVTIRKGSLQEMKELKLALEQEAIPSLIFGDEQSCKRGCCGGEMFLQIPAVCVEQALAVFAREFVKNSGLTPEDLCQAASVYDSSAGEIRCPACGCKFSPTLGACPDCGLCFE
jgi:hypothetical protein